MGAKAILLLVLPSVQCNFKNRENNREFFLAYQSRSPEKFCSVYSWKGYEI